MAAELWWLQLLSEDKVSDLQNQSPLSPKHSVLFSASLKTSQTKQDDYPTWELLSGSGTFQLTLYHLSNLRLKVLEVEGGQEAQGAQMECHDWRHATLRANETGHSLASPRGRHASTSPDGPAPGWSLGGLAGGGRGAVLTHRAQGQPEAWEPGEQLES